LKVFVAYHLIEQLEYNSFTADLCITVELYLINKLIILVNLLTMKKTKTIIVFYVLKNESLDILIFYACQCSIISRTHTFIVTFGVLFLYNLIVINKNE